MPGIVADAYLKWPLLSDLMPTSFSGVKTGRDDLVVDVDREKLLARIGKYFDGKVSDEEMRELAPVAFDTAGGFDAVSTRHYLLRRGLLPAQFRRYCYRPFDVRWVYWEQDTKLLDRTRPEYYGQVQGDNSFIFTTGRTRKDVIQPAICTQLPMDLNCMDSGARGFPLFLREKEDATTLLGRSSGPKPNLSETGTAYLLRLGFNDLNSAAECLFHHILAVLHAQVYRTENAGALRHDWPRIPLPATREALEASAALGRQVAALLDVQQPVKGVTAGKVGPELKAIGLITHVEGKQINDAEDLAVTAGWGNPGRGGITMPAGGKSVPRGFAPEELFALCGEPEPVEENDTITQLGGTTFDIYLNARVYWRNIPAAVWEYTLGGYQVIKKWLSYREHKILARPLRADEARYVTEMSRRIAAILLLHGELDENYARAASSGGNLP
jgi:hypothetical protein